MALFASNGMTFPQHINGRGFFEFTDDIQTLVQNSIVQILGTRLGERVMEPEFGSRIYELIFEPIDAILISLGRVYTIQAINRWEPRATLNDVGLTVDPDGGTFSIYVAYAIVNRNVEDSLAVSIPRLVRGKV